MVQKGNKKPESTQLSVVVLVHLKVRNQDCNPQIKVLRLWC